MGGALARQAKMCDREAHMELLFPITTDLLAVIAFWIRRLRLRLSDDCALTIPQFRVLVCLQQRQGNLRLNEVAEMLELSPNGTTYIIDRLEESGLLRRSPNTHDRRAIEIELLPQGAALIKRGHEVCAEVEKEITSPLGGYLKEIASRDIEAYQKKYSLQAKSQKYLSDGSALTTLILYDHRMNAVLKAFALSNVEFRVLFELVNNPACTNVGDLARSLLTKSTDITVACNKLCYDGCILRMQSNLDRRAIDVDITARGYERVRQAALAVDGVFLRATEDYTQEDRALDLKITRIIARSQRSQFRV